MADYGRGPTVRLRRLGRELRNLREAATKTIQEAADELEWSSAKISRMENGLTKRPDLHQIRAMCQAYGVTDERLVEALVGLARDARKLGWWTAYNDVFTGSYVGLEAEAVAISTFELALIPGLLQTPDYTTHITRAALIRDAREVERRVKARQERQEILKRQDPPRLWAVIDEAALLRPVGSREVREGQLRKLISTESLENVKIQILPMSAGAHTGLVGQFVILDFAEPTDRSVVYLETATDGLYLEEHEQLARYRMMFQHLCASALSVDASIAYLSALIDKL